MRFLLLLFLNPAAAVSPGHSSAGTDLPPLEDLIVPGTPRDRSQTTHRLHHPTGPEPAAWDGDWQEQDLDVTLARRPETLRVPDRLKIRVCWCPEVQWSARALPGGVGLNDH